MQRKKDSILTRMAIMLVVLLLVAFGAGGCGDLVAPHQAATSTTLVPSTGVNEDRFKEAWEKLKDIFVATAVASARSEFASLVDKLGSALDAVDAASLNEDEKAFRADFYSVHQMFVDSVALWTADSGAKEPGCEGIPLFNGDRPLVPRAQVIVEEHGLALSPVAGSSLRCVPSNSVGILWDHAREATEEWLLPVLSRR